MKKNSIPWKNIRGDKMKATVKFALPGFAGNMDDVVIYYDSKLN